MLSLLKRAEAALERNDRGEYVAVRDALAAEFRARPTSLEVAAAAMWDASPDVVTLLKDAAEQSLWPPRSDYW